MGVVPNSTVRSVPTRAVALSDLRWLPRRPMRRMMRRGRSFPGLARVSSRKPPCKGDADHNERGGRNHRPCDRLVQDEAGEDKARFVVAWGNCATAGCGIGGLRRGIGLALRACGAGAKERHDDV